MRGIDFSETSRIVTLLSPDRGRLACLARGVKRRKNPAGALLDTLNRVDIIYYWKDGREIQNLGEVNLLDSYMGIKGDLEKVTYAAFPVETAAKVAQVNEPSGELYRRFVNGLEGLAAWDGCVRVHVCWQTLQLLSVAGYEPALEHCAACGQDLSGNLGFTFDGGVTCGSCRFDRKLAKEEHDILLAMLKSRGNCPDLCDSVKIYRLLGGYASRQLETSFKSIRVIDRMFG